MYFNQNRRGAETHADALAAFEVLKSMGATTELDQYGDRSLVPGDVRLETPNRIRGMYGNHFAQAVTELPVGEWVGPVESGYGFHIVWIHERIPGELPPLDDIRDDLMVEWRYEQDKTNQEAFYQALRSRYDIVIQHTEKKESTE